MTKFVVLFFMLNGFTAMAALPPSQVIVDQYVFAALNLSANQIVATKGKLTCEYVAVHDRSLNGKGKDINEATIRLQLLCIRQRCEGLKSDVQKELEELLNLSENDFRNHLEFAGKGPEEIEQAIIARNTKSTNAGPALDCKNSSQFRTVVFDSCFSIPVACHK